MTVETFLPADNPTSVPCVPVGRIVRLAPGAMRVQQRVNFQNTFLIAALSYTAKIPPPPRQNNIPIHQSRVKVHMGRQNRQPGCKRNSQSLKKKGGLSLILIQQKIKALHLSTFLSEI